MPKVQSVEKKNVDREVWTRGVKQKGKSNKSKSQLSFFKKVTRRLHRRSLRLPTRRKWAQSGYLCTTPSTAQAGADAGISWS